MVEIRIDDFKGRVPRRSDRLLPPSYATVAENCDTYSGTLSGLRAPTVWHTFPSGTLAKKVFRVKEPDTLEEGWFASRDPEAVLLKSPLVNDGFQRWYLFGRYEDPKVITFEDILSGKKPSLLKVAGPDRAPVLSAAPISFADDIETRVYVISYVTSWGEESAPSAAASIDVKVGNTVTLRELYNLVPPQLEGRTYESIRVYRSIIGTASASLRFVGDFSYGRPVIRDNAPNAIVALNSPLTSFGNEPPVRGLRGAKAHPSGSLVAFHGRTVYFSRPNLPHAWPSEFALTVPDEIVGIEVVGQNVMVLTFGAPAMIYGTNPATMRLTLTSFPSPAVSAASIIAMPEGIYYASEDGIMLLTPNGVSNMTEPLMTRKEWQDEFFSAALQFGKPGGRFLAYSPDGRGFLLTKLADGTELTTLRGLKPNGVVYTDRYSAEVGILADDTLYHFDPIEGEESDYRWRSKEFVLPKPVNMETVQVEMTDRRVVYEPSGFMDGFKTSHPEIDRRGTIIFRAYADQELVAEVFVQDGEPVTLPRGFKATSWMFEVEGQCRLHSVTVTTSGKGQERG